MSFAGINYLAVFVAAIAGFMVGGVWYSVLFGERWMKAAGITKEDMDCEDGKKNSAMVPMVMAGVADLVMAWMLAGIIAHASGDVSIAKGLLAACFVWLGFVVTTNSVNYAFQMKPIALTIIDSGQLAGCLAGYGGHYRCLWGLGFDR